jgi:hypothetical protein
MHRGWNIFAHEKVESQNDTDAYEFSEKGNFLHSIAFGFCIFSFTVCCQKYIYKTHFPVFYMGVKVLSHIESRI